MEENFKLVRRFQYSSEAQIFSGKLESEGIEIYLRDNNIVDSNPLWSNNKLLKCPNCGAEEVKMVTSIKDLKTLLAFVFLLLFILMPFYSWHRYKCNKCKFEFN